MLKIINLFAICVLSVLFSCKKKISNDPIKKDNIVNYENNCSIPLEIENYLNKSNWSRVDITNYDKDLVGFLSNTLKYKIKGICPYFVYGDFTNDGSEDFAVILNKNHSFPFLLVFNNYKIVCPFNVH